MIQVQVRTWAVVRDRALYVLFVVGLCGLTACQEEDVPKTSDVPPTAFGGADPRNNRARAAVEAFNHWAPLLTSGDLEGARALCDSWLAEPDRGHHAEAHKCLANVTIGSSRTEVTGLPEGTEGSLPSLITSEGVDRALEHYNKALAIKPLGMDAHVGRVDLLIVGARYRDANVALEEALRTFASRDLLENWFKLLGRFRRAGATNEALAFLRVIEQHHPLDHRVISNIGAYLAIAGQNEEAFEYSTRAMAINPDDPINKWNLAKIHEQRDELVDADRLYQEALATIDENDVRARCEYASFLALRMKDANRACTFAETECTELFETNCTVNEIESEIEVAP